MNLVGVSKTTHATHDAEYVVVDSVDSYLSSRGALNGGVRENKLKGRVVNAREIAGARRLVFFRAESERVEIDAGVGGAGVVLEWLNEVEVGALTLREAVLSVKLELSGDDRVLSPAVHVEGGFGENEGARVGYKRATIRLGGGSRLKSRTTESITGFSKGGGA